MRFSPRPLSQFLRRLLIKQQSPLRPPSQLSDVHFYEFGTPDGRSMGHVGYHANGKIFVSSRLHPKGMTEAVQACAEDDEPIIWRTHPDDLIAYVCSKWLLRSLHREFDTPEHQWRQEAVTRMEEALCVARSGAAQGRFQQ